MNIEHLDIMTIARMRCPRRKVIEAEITSCVNDLITECSQGKGLTAIAMAEITQWGVRYSGGKPMAQCTTLSSRRFLGAKRPLFLARQFFAYHGWAEYFVIVTRKEGDKFAEDVCIYHREETVRPDNQA